MNNAFDKTLNDFFPDADQGHPQTANTRRLANIWAHVCDRLAEAGYTVSAYNFQETAHGVDYNMRVDDDEHTHSVAAYSTSYQTLKFSADASLIETLYRDNLNFLQTDYNKRGDPKDLLK